jgi:prephenate dehydrogenase
VTRPGSAAVLGLGLIGGSIARDLHAAGVTVLGWDADPETMKRAAAERVVRPMSGDLRAIDEVDLVVLAVPILAARDLLARIAARERIAAVITDVASTKASTLEWAEELGLASRFVGGHPLAGDDRAGWSASRIGLFQGARVFVAPCAGASEEATRVVTGMWTMLGARPEIVDADEHDRLMAWISHTPQAVSTALGLALADQGVKREELGPGGLGVTRLAASSPEIWIDILTDNGGEIARALRSVVARLDSLASAMEVGDVAELRRSLYHARDWACLRPDRPAESAAPEVASRDG